MNKYTFGKKLGEGTYGHVFIAYDNETGDRVAIKTLKDTCNDATTLMKQPEVQALRALSHPNIIHCKEFILDKEKRVHLVFELMTDGNLEAVCRKRRRHFTEIEIAEIAYQILSAVSYLHSSNFIHRDIKPENILISYPTTRPNNCMSPPGVRTNVPVIKLADLGLAKDLTRSSSRPFTGYVATRWYRAPEQLLRLHKYDSAADMWAIGATLAEMVTQGKPLFPGKDEREQLKLIISNRGHPAVVNWKEGAKAAARTHPNLPKLAPCSISAILRNSSYPLLQLIEDLLQLNPTGRPTAREALQYPFFQMQISETSFLRQQLRFSRVTAKALSSIDETQCTRAIQTPGCEIPSSTGYRTVSLERISEPSFPLFKIPRKTRPLPCPNRVHVTTVQRNRRSPAGVFNVVPTKAQPIKMSRATRQHVNGALTIAHPAALKSSFRRYP